MEAYFKACIKDLRITLASSQVKIGANSFVIQKTFDHKQQYATEVYAIITGDVTKEFMKKAVNDMLKYN